MVEKENKTNTDRRELLPEDNKPAETELKQVIERASPTSANDDGQPVTIMSNMTSTITSLPTTSESIP